MPLVYGGGCNNCTRQLLFLTISFLFLLDASHGDQKNGCNGDDWRAYKDEKCIKILDLYVSHKEAKSLCLKEQQKHQQNGYDDIYPLLTIKSKEEQDFLTRFLFLESGIVDNVWLGAQRLDNGSGFQWGDGSSLMFTNWQSGSPSKNLAKNCTQMISQDSSPSQQEPGSKTTTSTTTPSSPSVDGLWSDASCKRSNHAVCQKELVWTPKQTQRSISEMKKSWIEWRGNISYFHQKLTEVQGAVSELTKNWEESKLVLSDLKNNWIQLTENVSQLKKQSSDLRLNVEVLKGQLKESQDMSTQFRKELTESGQIVLELRRQLGEVRETLTDVKKHSENTQNSVQTIQSRLNNLQNNPVPNGFIYVQLPSTPEPSVLWPGVKWAEVTRDYGGLFFRAVGGDSEEFGKIQYGHSPRMHHVFHTVKTWDRKNEWPSWLHIKYDGWSQVITTSFHTENKKDFNDGLQFDFEGGEVRPKNTAVRIWRRVP